jgi:hypothetical protein
MRSVEATCMPVLTVRRGRADRAISPPDEVGTKRAAYRLLEL